MQRESGRTVKQIRQTGEVRERGGEERGGERGGKRGEREGERGGEREERGGRGGEERGRERGREGGKEGGARKRKLIFFFFHANEWQTSTKTPAPLIFL